jgi:DNA polymerase-3 subunit epsilon
VRSSHLERRLLAAVLLLFVLPAVVTVAVLAILHGTGSLGDPASLVTAGLVTFAAAAAYVATIARALGRGLVRSLQAIELGTELMATVNPGHRLDVATGDERASLAREINRLADQRDAARTGLEEEVARATRALAVERGTLSAILEALGEGVVVATVEGRVTLANRPAQELLGAGGESLVGRSLYDLVDREKVTLFGDRLTTTPGAAERFTLHPPGGAILEAVMTAFVEGEQALGHVLVLRDVTHPARSEETRQQLLDETLRQLRAPLSSVRSLSESLLADPALAASGHRRMLSALAAEAVRMAELVKQMGEPARLGLARPPRHFEELAVRDLLALTLRRLGPDDAGALRVEKAGEPLPPLRVEASALSAALARLAEGVLARRTPGDPGWLRARRRGALVQIEVGAAGTVDTAELEPLVDAAVTPGPAESRTVTEIVRQHAGEIWPYADAGRFGIRLTLPEADPSGGAPPAGADRASFAGAGLASGSGPALPERPIFYDFSLFEEMERSLSLVDRERPLAELTYVVLDVETTGLEPDRGDGIVSLAGVRVRGGSVRRAETFDALVNPGRPIPGASVRFHGITDGMVEEAPPIEVVLPAFLHFAGSATLVGHEVWFDLRFLGRAAAAAGLPAPGLDRPVLDTLLLSEVVHGPLAGHGLDDVAARVGAAVRGRHSALGDALTTAEVFVRLVELLARRNIVTLGQAVEAARRARRRWSTAAPSSGSPA